MVKDKAKIKVFVYGSLKKDKPLHRLLARGAEVAFLGRNYIEEPLLLADMGAYPALIHDDFDPKARYKTFGEVYSVDPETLASLDMAEGHPLFFKRRKLPVRDGKSMKCWVYVLSKEASDYANDWIDEGVWRPTDKELEYVANHTK